jgi:O-antigen/teichoic acid export membrane protein
MLKKLLKDMVVYSLSDFIFKFINFAIFPVYAHIFSVSEFGIIGLIASLTGVVDIVVALGLNNSVQRYYWDPKTLEEHRPVLVSTGLFILLTWSLLVTLLSLVLLYPFRELVQQKYEIAWIYIILTFTGNVATRIVLYSKDVLRLHFAPWLFTILSACVSIIGVSLGLLMVVILGLGLYGYFLGNFIAIVLSVPFSLWFIKKDFVFKFNKVMAKELIRYGYPFIFTGAAYWIFGSLDRWMISSFANNTEVGLYNIAFKFTNIIVFVLAAFGQAWSPYAV